MKLLPEDLKKDIEQKFNVKELTPEQAWVLVKLMKHARLRCRNNSALNNYMRTAFTHLRFDQVEKRRADGTPYDGLCITWRDHARQLVADVVIEEGED
jgi:hypothetical protein